jgi:hypothetical protein
VLTAPENALRSAGVRAARRRRVFARRGRRALRRVSALARRLRAARRRKTARPTRGGPARVAVVVCVRFLRRRALPRRADPFADEADAPEEDNEGVVKGKTYVHVRVQQRNGRKSLTTVQARVFCPLFWPLAYAPLRC